MRKPIKDVFKNWFETNGLEIQQVGANFYGSHAEVEKAKEIIQTNPPKIPYEVKTVPGGINIEIVAKNVKSINRRLQFDQRLIVNKRQRTVTYPNS